MRKVSIEEAWGVLRSHDYNTHFEGGWQMIHNDVPVAIFGSAQGKVHGGRHLLCDDLPVSNVHLSVLEMVGAPTREYLSNDTADATGVIKELAG